MKHRLLLLIVQSHDKSNLVVGHCHEIRNVFVAVKVPYARGGARPTLQVTWWTDIPQLPESVVLRPLTKEDTRG